MKTDPADVLKEALLLEKRGYAFYKMVSVNIQDKATRRFFELMADEEKNHIQLLVEELKMYQSRKKFTRNNFDDTTSSQISDLVLSSPLQDRISAAEFEAAAISAAMLMEERAIKLYADRANASTDTDEKRLYNWLADWERSHLKYLTGIDQALKEKIWNDNQFWPF
ncbi:MAG: ferritin family protein [Desulfobacterales bacterium]|nr:ferritin family protein [Desulfobacterales bacterium]